MAPCANLLTGLLQNRRGASIRDWITHHAYDFGQFLGIGLLCAATATFLRHKRVSPATSHLLLTVVAITIGSLTLTDDLRNFARNFQTAAALPLVIILISLLIPLAAISGDLLQKTRWHSVALISGASLLVANNVALQRDYDGVHLFVTWFAAILVGKVLINNRQPKWVSQFAKSRFFWLLASIAAIVTIVIPPPPRIAVSLAEASGSTVAHHIAALRTRLATPPAPHAQRLPSELREWFQDRSAQPPIPPTRTEMFGKTPIVILITIDSMRADILSDSSVMRTLPHIAQLIKTSTVFTNARAPGSSTMTVMGAIFTGKHQTQLQWTQTAQTRLNISNDDTERITESLGRHGIESFQSVSFEFLQRQYGVTRGITAEEYISPPEGQRYALSEVLIPPLVQHLRSKSRESFFLHAHLMDAHYPYDAVQHTGSPKERYLAELRLCDQALGKLLEAISELDLFDRVTLIVAADHGEGFGQHNTPYHTNTVYEELVRVPLLIRTPTGDANILDNPVSLIDLGPTILDIFGIPTPGHHMGQTLVPLLQPNGPPTAMTRPIAGVARGASAHPAYYYVTPDNIKAVWDLKLGAYEVYDLNTDPHEENNIYDQRNSGGQDTLRLLVQFFGSHPFSKTRKVTPRGCAR